MGKISNTYRLSPEAMRLIKRLAKDLGVSQASVIEMAVRKLAKDQQSG